MEEWYKTRGNIGIIVGLMFFVAAFIWIWYFFKFVQFSPLDRLTGWLGAVITGFLFFAGFYVGFSIKTRKALIVAMVCFVWSLGFLVLPVPEGYAETVYGGWAILLMAMIALYAKYEESKKKKAQIGKETEKK